MCGYRICEMCIELDCSERYLYEVFSRDLGTPPKKWLRTERMVVAIRKLEDGKPPREVARDLGFATTSSFRREFMGYYQLPPLEFLQQRREEAGDSRANE